MLIEDCEVIVWLTITVRTAASEKLYGLQRSSGKNMPCDAEALDEVLEELDGDLCSACA